MRRGLLAGIVLLAFAANAEAKSARSCPTQTLTIVNQANVRPSALAKVEHALAVQARQLRASYGTPCIRFGPGGWKIYLKVNDGQNSYRMPAGEHYAISTFAGNWLCSAPGYCVAQDAMATMGAIPYANVMTGGWPLRTWSATLSHEVVEMLANPDTTGTEICDPVEMKTYRINGVYVSDFVLPHGSDWIMRYSHTTAR